MSTNKETTEHTPEEIAEAIAVLLETPGLPVAIYNSLSNHVTALTGNAGQVTAQTVRADYARAAKQAG
jgi:hypothetical protein